MAVFDLYSKRRKRELNGDSDVYQYDTVPPGLRQQIIQIWGDAIGIPNERPPEDYFAHAIEDAYWDIVDTLRREYGVPSLARSRNPSDRRYALAELRQWFLSEANTDRVIDAIEITFLVIDRYTRGRDYIGRSDRADQIATDAIQELNTRFREHGVGYEYSDGKIIRIDSRLVHKEAVVPALAVLRRKGFESPQAEFLRAYEHFRHGNKPEALVDCYKAFESTMKVICDKRKWAYPTNAAAKDLVKVCLDNGLIPTYWQNHFAGLRSVLESAIATPRNKQAGHGAGSNPVPELPNELVSYVLHMTASTILYLSEAANLS